jgi:hypothetical protein
MSAVLVQIMDCGWNGAFADHIRAAASRNPGNALHAP